MKPFGLFILTLFAVGNVAAQFSDYDSTYLLNNCVVLDAKESIQEQREDLIYKWTFGEGATSHGEVVEHCYDSLGTYEVVLSIIDPLLNASFQEEWLFQVAITENYKLTLGVQKQGASGISFSSKLVYQNAPEEVNFFWDYGDGTFGIGEEVEHKYKREGQYQIRLLAKIEDQGAIIHLAQTRTIIIDGDDEI